MSLFISRRVLYVLFLVGMWGLWESENKRLALVMAFGIGSYCVNEIRHAYLTWPLMQSRFPALVKAVDDRAVGRFQAFLFCYVMPMAYVWGITNPDGNYWILFLGCVVIGSIEFVISTGEWVRQTNRKRQIQKLEAQHESRKTAGAGGLHREES